MAKEKLLFILSGNISTTPRALKTILFYQEKFEINIIAINRNKLWGKMDEQICEQNHLKYKIINLYRTKNILWYINSLKQKLSKIITKLFKNNIKQLAFSNSKATVFLYSYINKNRTIYKAIFANSFGSFYPAYILSQKLNIPLILDIEDYHPGEVVSNEKEIERRKFLMKSILPKANYITYASPLIGQYTLKLVPDFPKEKTMLINNCFPQSEFQFKENNSEKVKFVWFSQNIAKGRGLELVLPALDKFKNKVELHLIGNLYQNFYDEYLSKYKDIVVIHKSLPQKELNLKLSEFDVGLAIELNTADLNRQICLTNKIWAYFQAGLYILSTDTPAQIQFMKEHLAAGLITKQNSADFSEKVDNILKNISKIRQTKSERFERAKQFSWENESKKLIKIWQSLNEPQRAQTNAK